MRKEIKSLLTDFLAEFKGKSRGEGSGGKGDSSFNKGDDDFGKMKDNHEEEVNSDVSSFWKLDMPLFSGEDPIGWIFRAERYFKVNRVTEKEKLDAAVLCFENRALNWFQWREVRAPIKKWEELKQDLVNRFQPSQSGTAYEMLMALRQNSSITEYIEKFELMSAALGSCDEEMLKAAFMNGLKVNIKADLRLLRFPRLAELMEMALRIEERDEIKSSIF